MSLARVLDDCLQAIELHGATIEGCLERHSHVKGELEPLLRLALRLKSAPDVKPSPAFKRVTRERLLRLARPVTTEKRVAEAPWESVLRSLARWRQRVGLVLGKPRWQPALARAIPILLALLLIGGGTVYASADSLPGSPLYPVKRGVERTRLFLAPTLERSTLLHLEFADKRLAEGIIVARQGKNDQANQLISEYGRELDLTLSTVEEMAAQGRRLAQLSTQLQTQLASQRQVLEATGDQLPPEALEIALDAAQQAEDELVELETPGPVTSTPSPVPSPIPTIAPGEPVIAPQPPDPTPTLTSTATPFVPTPTGAPGSPTPILRAVTATPSPMATGTASPLTATPTLVPPTATGTPLSLTATRTPVRPTATGTPLLPTLTPTLMMPTATETLQPPTLTPTSVPPTATKTPLPPPPTATPKPYPPPTETPEPPTPTPEPPSPTPEPPTSTPEPTPYPQTNHAPVINEVICEPCTIQTRETATLTCNSSDPDGDPLTFEWWASPMGILQDEDEDHSQVTYQANYDLNPSITELEVTITVTVRDGRGGLANGSVSITVIPPRD